MVVLLLLPNTHRRAREYGQKKKKMQFVTERDPLSKRRRDWAGGFFFLKPKTLLFFPSRSSLCLCVCHTLPDKRSGLAARRSCSAFSSQLGLGSDIVSGSREVRSVPCRQRVDDGSPVG